MQLVSDHQVSAWAVILGVTVLSATSGHTALRLARAPRWSLILTNSTGGAITAVRLRFRHRATGAWGPWEAVSTGLPLADAGALRLNDTYGSNACDEMDVEVTAAAAGPVALDLVGS